VSVNRDEMRSSKVQQLHRNPSDFLRPPGHPACVNDL